jgi:CRISPR-associated protein (TIGR03986 family)
MPDAITPYNFVPLPDRILSAEIHVWTKASGNKPEERRFYPRADQYHEKFHTGWFALELTALTPIYTRAPRRTEQTSDDEQPPEFFQRPDGAYIIPGSGLRGMIRSLFEIMTQSNLEYVSRQRLFYRSFAEVRNTNLRAHYASQFNKDMLHGGLLVEGQDGRLKLHVSKRAKKGWVVVRETKLNRAWTGRQRGEFKPPRQVTVGQIGSSTHRMLDVAIADDIKDTGSDWLIVPGEDVRRRDGTQRTWFQVILNPTNDPNNYDEYDVPEDVYRDYLAWGDMAHGARFGEEKKNANGSWMAPRKLKAGQPAFALVAIGKREVQNLGANMMMHLRYRNSIEQVVARGLDGKAFSPEVDMAQSLFGRVRDLREGDKKNEQTDQIRSRVFFEDAVCETQGAMARLHPDRTDKALLSSPKPTAFQVYLQQPDSRSLIHWDGAKALLAGRKLYWHRSSDAAIRSLQESTISPTLKSGERKEQRGDLIANIQPLKSGVKFIGRVRFENLTDIELGALYAAIRLPDGLAHKFGMAKSLGLGSLRVEVTGVRLLNMRERFASLDANAGVQTESDTQRMLLAAYTAFVQRLAPGSRTLWGSDRMKTLAALLTWTGRPPDRLTEQMGFDDQWKYRWTLPQPRQLATLQLISDVLPVTPLVSVSFVL